jgi:cytoskeleton protein RodZ
MSEQAANGSQVTSQADAEGLTQPPVSGSAGLLLREAREAAGVDIGMLAQALKVSVRKLEALEQDRYEQLPDAVFTRALAASVCRALKIDPAPVLARLPQGESLRLSHDDSGLNTPFFAPGDLAKVPFWDRLSRPMVLAALAALLGALVIILFPSAQQRAEIGAIVNRAATAPVPPPPGVAVVPVAVPAAAHEGAPAQAAGAAQSDAQPPALATADHSPSDAEAVERKKPAASGVLVFRTREPSWVEVVDAGGTVQISRVLAPGESVGVDGTLPLSVVIGRADVTEVQVRGKPYDLAPVTRQGVARFEVK